MVISFRFISLILVPHPKAICRWMETRTKTSGLIHTDLEFEFQEGVTTTAMHVSESAPTTCPSSSFWHSTTSRNYQTDFFRMVQMIQRWKEVGTNYAMTDYFTDNNCLTHTL